MKVDIYNQAGEIIEQMDLPKEVFEEAFNSDLVHQVLVSMQSNKRQGSAHTKDRGEVSGGGKKPWRQKGTGRARHGSTRSPIWIGGGVTFGPRNERNYKKNIPVKIRKKALKCLLSQKLRDKEIFIIDDLKIEEPKTKIIVDILEKLSNKIKKEKFKTLLIVSDQRDDKLLRAIKNIPNINIIGAKNLNSLAVASYKDLLITKKSIKTIKDVLCK